MTQYSMSFIAKIHHLFELCLEVSELEYNSNKKIEKELKKPHFSMAELNELNTGFEKQLEKLKSDFNLLLFYVFKESRNENFYFTDCPFQVYQNFYKKRKRHFLRYNFDAREKDFICLELSKFENPNFKKGLSFAYKDLNEYMLNFKQTKINFNALRRQANKFEPIISFNKKFLRLNYARLFCPTEAWTFTLQRKMEFLTQKLACLEELQIKPETISETPSNLFTTNQSVLLLDQLGVFASPYFENIAKSKQAEILSRLLGKNAKNIKSAIEKLDKSAFDVGQGFTRDMAKIQAVFNQLEYPVE
ncbi:hypothetical protein [Namhaeicola litoreus]|uniref:RteC protein n=1 Tax=Namhaeicola litoreus TaxID=1052145 RepID=A0ABW3Y2C1_9FLAO